jgi:4'-phosphopantetheinyl transferase
VAMDAWRFVNTGHGRPMIAWPDLTPQLYFSVANTRGLVACAISRTADLGLDVERGRDVVPPGLIARCLTDGERATLSKLPSHAHSRRFVVLWTLKEAYIKARGLGLSIPLQQIDVVLDGDSPRLTLDPALGDDGTAWQLVTWSPTPSHVASVCVRRGAGPPCIIDPRWVEDSSLPRFPPRSPRPS